ncbi:HD domain-containing protein [Candidatus Bathyarchaeota archaeon]|nr:HD domain-containing protein [Candidatus Bathyarchaeota archaeon]
MFDESVFEMIKRRGEEYLRFSHHDRYHVERVHRMAMRIAAEEGADMDVVRAAALLHDVARAMEDEGVVEDHAAEGAKIAEGILRDVGFPEEKISRVVDCIRIHRFKRGDYAGSVEAGILQDADRLDALGAIGIARVFARGGWENKPIHDPSIPPKERYDGESLTSVNHIYEKILRLREELNTDTARRISEERHRFVKQFLERFLREWEAEI